MSDRVIQGKLLHIQQRLELLRRFKDMPWDRFAADEVVQLATERALQEVIEACLDIGRRLLLGAGHPVPDTNRNVFLALARLGLLPLARVEAWADMAGFRNVLVHEYEAVDLRIVHGVLTGRLGDVDAFAEAVVAQLDRADG